MGSLCENVRNLARPLRGFVHDRGGNVIMILALALVPMLGLVGLAVDYANASAKRTSLTSAADAAALAAVSSSSLASSATWERQDEASLRIARQHFQGSTADYKASGILKNATFDVNIVGNVVNVRICFEGAVRTTLLAVLGRDEINIANCSVSVVAPPVYMSVYALVDASGSMGIAASTSDQELMRKELGCVFACHTLDWKVSSVDATNPRCENFKDWKDGRATTTCAHRIGVQTRFDIVRQALSSVVEDTGRRAIVNNQFRFAIYKFSNHLTEIQSSTADFRATASAINRMQPDIRGAGTNFRRAMEDLYDKMPESGDGKTPETPIVVLLVLTDGVEGNVREVTECQNGVVNGVTRKICNYWGEWEADRRLRLNEPGFNVGRERSQVVNAKVCDQFKDSKKILISTLHTEYLVPPGTKNERFSKIRDELGPTISANLKMCASNPSVALDARTPEEITAAIRELFNFRVVPTRIGR